MQEKNLRTPPIKPTRLKFRGRKLLPQIGIQAVKFVSVGFLNTFLDAVVYFVLTRWVGFSAMKALAKALSYSVGIINSYFWNRSWTFQSEKTGVKLLLTFIFTNLLSLGLNAGVMAFGLHILAMPEITAFLAATVCTMGWNFLISKYWIFKS